MEFLNLITLPNSIQTLKLFEFLFFFGYVILFSFVSLCCFSLAFSIYFAFLGKRKADVSLFEISNNFAKITGKTLLPAFLLGLVPFFGVYFILIQFAFDPQLLSLNFLPLFILLLLAIVFLYLYKTRLRKWLETRLNSSQIVKLNFLTLLFALMSFVSFLLFVWTFSTLLVLFFEKSTNFNFFALPSVARIIDFVLLSMFFAPLAYIYFNITEVKSLESQSNLEVFGSSRNLIALSSAFGIPIPIFLLLNYAMTPKVVVNFLYFVFNIVLIFVLLFAFIFSYYSYKENKLNFANVSFFLAVTALIIFIAGESNLFAYSNKVQEYIVSKNYEEQKTQLLLASGRATITVNGEEIYKTKCVACHQFETVLVGPPHKEVLKKYEGRMEDMVKYVLNPTKVDPKYPPMPNQGLKPNEAEAVVKYMFEHYGPMLK